MKISPITQYNNHNLKKSPSFSGHGAFTAVSAIKETTAFRRGKSLAAKLVEKIKTVRQNKSFNKTIDDMKSFFKNDEVFAQKRNVSQFKTDILNAGDIAAKNEENAALFIDTVLSNISKVKDSDIYSVMMKSAVNASLGNNLGRQDFLNKAVSMFLKETKPVQKGALALYINTNDTQKIFLPVLKQYVKEEPRAAMFLEV